MRETCPLTSVILKLQQNPWNFEVINNSEFCCALDLVPTLEENGREKEVMNLKRLALLFRVWRQDAINQNAQNNLQTQGIPLVLNQNIWGVYLLPVTAKRRYNHWLWKVSVYCLYCVICRGSLRTGCRSFQVKHCS